MITALFILLCLVELTLLFLTVKWRMVRLHHARKAAILKNGIHKHARLTPARPFPVYPSAHKE